MEAVGKEREKACLAFCCSILFSCNQFKCLTKGTEEELQEEEEEPGIGIETEIGIQEQQEEQQEQETELLLQLFSCYSYLYK